MGKMAGFILSLIATQANACGAMTEHATLTSVTAPGDLALDPGGRARLAGLALDPRALVALGGKIGRSLGVAYLAPSPDRWGRRSVDLFEPEGKSLSLSFVEQGEARVRAEPETRGCEAERLDAERGARAAGEGVWAAPGAVIDAADLAALDAAQGRFVLVAGRVRRAGGTRSRIYLDFAPARGLSVTFSRKLAPQFARAGVEAMDLPGRRVLVRGVLDGRFGPRIEIADPAMIETLESAKESSRGG